MADATQVPNTLLSHALLTNAATAAGLSVVGTEVSVAGYLSAQINVFYAAIEAIANDPGVDFILQGRQDTGATINENWVDLWTITAPTAAAVASEISGVEAIGETTIAVDADPTSAFLPGTDVYIEDTGTVTDGEWAKVAISATGANIVTLVDGLTRAKDAADTIWTQAMKASGQVSLDGISYVRMIIQNTDTSGVNIHYKATMISMSEIV